MSSYNVTILSLHPNLCLKIPFSTRKEEMRRALDVPLVGLLRLVVPSVPRAVRVRMAKAVKVARRVNFVLAV